VEHGHLPFFQRDICHIYVILRSKHVTSGAMSLLQNCKDAKEENSKFHYAIRIDDERKLKHIFWAPYPCIDWYQKYGDVVVFDTTYKVNAYDMPFCVFVGVNNHRKTILFGCALLYNKTTSAS